MTTIKPNNFGLSFCKKTSLRRRTLSGITSYYYTYFTPKGLNKHNRVYAINSFKHPNTEECKIIASDMINHSVYTFVSEVDLNQFDVILGMPSSSPVVKTVIDKLVFDCGFEGNVFYKGFRKTRIRNTRLKQQVLSRESSLKTKEKVPEAFNHTRQLHYDKVSKISLFPTRFRRYVENVFELNVNPTELINKKILVIDDTIGEGFTMCEVTRMLSPYTSNVIGFTVMKDIE
jgi:hypothetical protein